MVCEAGLNSLQLPEWFTAINSDCRAYCSLVRHFGAAWGEVVADQLQVTCNAPGTFWVMSQACGATNRSWRSGKDSASNTQILPTVK